MTEQIITDSAGTAGAAVANQSSESVNQTTQAAAPTETAPNTDAQATAPIEGMPQEKPAYTPNYKFKAFQKEMELDPFWHPLIKDPDSEKKVKDLFTRAEAFDDLKSRYEGTQEEFVRVYNDFAALDQDVRKVTSFLNRGDLDNFFSSIGLDENKIIKWVADKLDQENLPPEQKNALKLQQQERQRLYELEMEKTSLEEQYQTQAVQARTMQLDMVLSRPEVSQAASAWDSRMGQIGAFRDLVVEEAQKAWYTQKQDLSVEQAVHLVMTKYGKLLDVGGMASQNASPQAPAAQAQSPQAAQKPVIPAVNGRGTSPVKKSPNSIEDLKALAREMGA